MGNVKDMTGKRFGRWTALYENGRSKCGAALWRCVCDCGVERDVVGGTLRSGISLSCGCTKADHMRTNPTNLKHGGKRGGHAERLYRIFRGMHDRCYNPNSRFFFRYGGRGVTICDEWLSDYAKFREWALQSGYEETLTIDRIDNNKGYSPGNCRWVSSMVQCNNRSSNHVITFNNESLTLSEWARRIGVAKDTLRRRIVVYKWSVERALTTPNLHKH